MKKSLRCFKSVANQLPSICPPPIPFLSPWPHLHAAMTHSQNHYNNICLVCRINVVECLPNPEKLSNKKLMLRHYQDSHPEKLVACIKAPECELTFVSHQLMKYHFERVHLNKRFPCQYCPRSFANFKSFRFHLDVEHHGETDTPKTFLCTYPDCEASFSCRQNLSYHTLIKHKQINKPPVPTPCPLCGEMCIQLMHHKVVKHGDPGLKLPCRVCSLIFPLKMDLNAHMKKEHPAEAAADGLIRPRPKKPPVVHACPHCPATFGGEVGKKGLERHVRGVHEKVRYPCPICERSYFSQGDMRSHVRSVHQGIKLPCRTSGCTMQFGRASDRNRHERNAHGSPSSRDGRKDSQAAGSTTFMNVPSHSY